MIGFSRVSRQVQPLILGELVDRYFDGVINGTFADMNGEVDKLMGDAVMAHFQSTKKAYQAYLKIKELLAKINHERVADGLEPYSYGIGISFGTMAYGNFGNNLKMDRTVVGAVVNQAERLEKKCRELGVEALVTEHFLQDLDGDSIYARPLDFVRVGESEPMTVYELFSHDSEELRQLKTESIPFLTEAIGFKKAGKLDDYQSALDAWARQFSVRTHAEHDSFLQKCAQKSINLRRVI